jgi:hypothetical protein
LEAKLQSAAARSTVVDDLSSGQKSISLLYNISKIPSGESKGSFTDVPALARRIVGRMISSACARLRHSAHCIREAHILVVTKCERQDQLHRRWNAHSFSKADPPYEDHPVKRVSRHRSSFGESLYQFATSFGTHSVHDRKPKKQKRLISFSISIQVLNFGEMELFSFFADDSGKLTYRLADCIGDQ